MIENGSWRVRVGRTVSRFAIMMLIVLGVVCRSTVLAADEHKHKGSDDREHSGWADREHEGSGDREHEGSGDRERGGSGHKVVLASDWSHRHLMYSAPKNPTDAFSLSNETRYVQQYVRRNAEQRERGIWHHQEDPLNGDWSMFLGNLGTVGVDRYPAKFSYDVTTANCGPAPKPDFVVYNTSLAPSAAAASAQQTGTFTGAPTAGQTVQINNPNIAGGLLTLTADAIQNSGLFFQIGGTTTITATNLTAAINRPGNGSSVGVRATSAANIVTVISTNVGTADNSITWAASAGTPLTINGAGFLAGGLNGASIVAFDNLYTGCGGVVPSTFWAYNTGGTITTSITLSGDGSQVAFVQTNNGTTFAELVLLKWKASITDTVNNPTTLAVTPAANYRTCVAPCMTVFSLTANSFDTNSSPFYDFAPGSDKLYVADDSGNLLQFTGVFAGTPAKSGAPYPVPLGGVGTLPTSPVFDQGAGKVYVADNAGFLYSVDPTNGAKITSAQLSAILGFVGAPVVDSSTGQIYLFTSDGSPTTCTGTGLPSVFQIPVGFLGGAGASSTANLLGTCSDFIAMYDGEFDNVYYNSATGTGHMYVCGNPGGTPTLYQITVTNGALGAVTTGPTLGTTNFACSPVTEVFNPGAGATGTDWIFLSVQDSAVTGIPISCPLAAGCIMSFDVTLGAPINIGTVTAARATASGGTSGIVLDNTVGAGTLAGASQVYFSTLTNGACPTSPGTTGGCGVQASQSGLN